MVYEGAKVNELSDQGTKCSLLCRSSSSFK